MRTPAERGPGDPFRVVVVGAGYAGVIAANRVLSTLARRGDAELRAVEVTVLNPRPDFVQRIRLHEVAAGTAPTAVLPLTDVLHPAARLRVGAAEHIDPLARTVHGPGLVLGYDALIYAVGSRSGDGVPGSSVHAHQVADVDGAQALRRTVAGLGPGGVIAVVGGGLTGVEIAAELAERHPRLRVRLVSSGRIAAGLGGLGRRRVASALAGLRVDVHENRSVSRIEQGELVFADGACLQFDACVWAGPMAVPPLAADSGLPVDPSGRLLVDRTLRCPDHPQIVGAGDAVAAPSSVAGHLRMSCAAALPLGAHAAGTVLVAIETARGRPTTASALSLGFLVQAVSLGRASGVVQPVRPDDVPRRFSVGGRAAAWTKERICRYTVSALKAERDRPGALRVTRGPRPASFPDPASTATPGRRSAP